MFHCGGSAERVKSELIRVMVGQSGKPVLRSGILPHYGFTEHRLPVVTQDMTFCTHRTMAIVAVPIVLFVVGVESLIAQTAVPQEAANSEEQRPTAVPSESADAAVERFVAECVRITPGADNFPATFSIGTENPGENEVPLKPVELSTPFRISRFETTQELYQAVIGKNPSRWKGPRNSVENVTYEDVQRFCAKLTAMLRERKLIPQNQFVRLPTSVEWEYCCRAGSGARYCFGNEAGPGETTTTLDEYAWHTGNAAGNDPAVGVLKANDWGLCDVHGYLWEFVADDAETGAKAASQQAVIRGGSWRDHHSKLSCSTWSTLPVDAANDAVGFRCVITEKPAIKKPPKQ